MSCFIGPRAAKIFSESNRPEQNQSNGEIQRHNQDVPLESIGSLLGTCCIDGMVASFAVPNIISGHAAACPVIASSVAVTQCSVATACTFWYLNKPENCAIKSSHYIITLPCSLLMNCFVVFDNLSVIREGGTHQNETLYLDSIVFQDPLQSSMNGNAINR